MNIGIIIHPHAISNLYDFLSSVKHKRRFCEMVCFGPYNESVVSKSTMVSDFHCMDINIKKNVLCSQKRHEGE